MGIPVDQLQYNWEIEMTKYLIPQHNYHGVDAHTLVAILV